MQHPSNQNKKISISTIKTSYFMIFSAYSSIKLIILIEFSAV